MKKLRVVTGVSNHAKSVRISLLLDEQVIKLIDQVLLKFHPEGSYFEYYNEKKGLNEYSYSPKKLVDEAISFFSNAEETGWIFIQRNHIQIVLLKDAKLAKEVEAEIFNLMDFVDPPKEKSKARVKKK